MVTMDDGSWDLHAELTRPMTAEGLANGTIFSAFAAQAPNEPKLHIQLSDDKKSEFALFMFLYLSLYNYIYM